MDQEWTGEVREVWGDLSENVRAEFEPLMAELWALRDLMEPVGEVRFSAIDALAPALLDRGIAQADAARMLLSAGRSLHTALEERGVIDRQTALRLSQLLDEALIQLVTAVEQGRRARRQAWLSYLVHELKNPLNTVLNALWLIREKGTDPKQAARFVELAERAVRRLEGRTRDVRELDERLLQPPAGWEERSLRPSSG